MEDKNTHQQNQSTANSSNIIFGTSSDDIEQGLHNGQFIDAADASGIDDKDQIVNAQEQNAIVNRSEEDFGEEQEFITPGKDSLTSEAPSKAAQPEENVVDLEPEDDTDDNTAGVSKAED